MDGTERLREDEGEIEAMEDQLSQLLNRFNSGEMLALGPNTDKVMKEMDKMRQRQVDLSVEQIDMEISYPELESEQAEATTDENAVQIREEHLQKVTRAFEEKEGQIFDLSEKLKNLAGEVDSVNDAIRDSQHF